MKLPMFYGRCEKCNCRMKLSYIHRLSKCNVYEFKCDICGNTVSQAVKSEEEMMKKIADDQIEEMLR